MPSYYGYGSGYGYGYGYGDSEEDAADESVVSIPMQSADDAEAVDESHDDTSPRVARRHAA